MKRVKKCINMRLKVDIVVSHDAKIFIIFYNLDWLVVYDEGTTMQGLYQKPVSIYFVLDCEEC